jgi:hypothetical protein
MFCQIYYWGDQVMESEVGGMHGGDEKFIQNFGWQNLKGRDHLEDLGIDGKIIL